MVSSGVRTSRARSGFRAVLLVVAVAFGVLPATAVVYPQQAAADTAIAVPDSAADEVTAAQFAKKGHKTVQVTGKTTEIGETVANPDGSLTTTSHTRPVRVRQNGAWVAPDSTLTPKAGALAPKAGTTDISVSAGRNGQLVRLSRDGTTTGLDWPGALPAPVVSGSTATYPEVLPGVDLRVQTDVDTVHEVVVLKTPEAAKTLRKFDLSVPVRNGTVTKDADGTLRVRDAKGVEKFTAPPATMWDSSGIDAVGRDFVRGPAPGGRQAAVGEVLSGTKLTLTPDPKLLADAAYPVYVDPVWHDNYCTWCGRNHYLVQYACGSGKTPGFAEWDSDDNLRAGYVNDPNASCSGSHLVTARSFVEMNLAGLGGKLIYGAQLNLGLTNPGNCGASNNVVWSGVIGAGLKFNSGPPWWNTVATVSGCPSNVGFDITGTIQTAVNGNAPTWTFGIVSPNEGDFATWKKYSTQVGFSVTYNSPPNQPTNLALYNGTQAYPCASGPNRPVIGRTSTGYVARANASDPDGQQLYAGFRVYNGLTSTGQYSWDGREFGVDNVLSDGNTANRNAAVTLPTDEMNADGFYSWDTHTIDGRETAWAAPCEVEVELSAPAAPAVTSQTYPAGTYGGGPGRPGDFTFTVANSPTTVDHYVWKIDNTAAPSCNGTEAGTVKPNAFNGPGSTAIAPGSSGAHVLSAWACNRANTPSNRVDYAFLVKDAAAPVASWQLEGNGKSQVTGLRYAGAGSGTFVGGKLGQAASLTGQSGDYFATSARIVDTAKSFSVSAWVNAADLSSRRAVLSQDGTQTSGFALQYLESGKWAFSISGADVSSPTVTSALSTVVPAVGTWTHLAGVYDAAAHTATLYVNGQAQQTVSVTAPAISGPLVLGGAKSGSVRSYLLKGSIDEAAAFDHALSTSDVATLYGQNGAPTGLSAVREYTLDGDAADATGIDGVLTFAGSGGYGAGYSDSAAQSATESNVGQATGRGFIGGTANGSAHTSGPIVDTTQSFTVSAWAKLDDLNSYYAVVSQDGVHSAGFQLRYSPDVNRWIMGLPVADADADGYRWAIGTSVPQAGVWTHVTGVYDAVAGKVLLYVNGVLEAQTAIPAGSTWNATGAFQIGQVHWYSQTTAYFHGSIDQVQVWDRPLPATEVAGVANTAVLRANYQLDGTATDAITGTNGVLSGGAALTTDAAGKNVARFDKSWTGQIEGPRPQNLRSDQSFTVEGWVRHTWTDADIAQAKQADATNPAGVDESARAIVGVNSAEFSPYLLGYRGQKDANGVWHPKWSWLLTLSTSNSQTQGGWVMLPERDADSNVWTHLTGTYDAVTHTACLHAATDTYQFTPTCMTGVNGWNGASALEDLFLGRGRWTGVNSDFWYGDVRGVRLYTGVLDTQHINADAILDHP